MLGGRPSGHTITGPAFAHPRFVEFIEAIPLAATNKPDRRRLTADAERIADARRAVSRAG
jgi:hypothetical protein